MAKKPCWRYAAGGREREREARCSLDGPPGRGDGGCEGGAVQPLYLKKKTQAHRAPPPHLVPPCKTKLSRRLQDSNLRVFRHLLDWFVDEIERRGVET